MISSCCCSASDSGLNSLTALKEAVLIATRTLPPLRSDRSLLNIVKPECDISELLIFWFNHVSLTHITSEFSAYTRSWKRRRLHTDCQFVVLLCDNFLSFWHSSRGNWAYQRSRSRNRSRVRIDFTRHQKAKGSIWVVVVTNVAHFITWHSN